MKLNKKYIKVVLCTVLLTFLAGSAIALVDLGSDTLIGTVDQTSDGVVITADSVQCLVSGYDLSDMVGKTVTVTGTISTDAGPRTIEVTSVEVVQ